MTIVAPHTVRIVRITEVATGFVIFAICGLNNNTKKVLLALDQLNKF